jgi:hypothetical protein
MLLTAWKHSSALWKRLLRHPLGSQTLSIDLSDWRLAHESTSASLRSMLTTHLSQYLIARSCSISLSIGCCRSQTLCHLQLHILGWSSLDGLLRILACVPAVETLAIYVGVIYTIEVSTPAPLFPEHLRNLHLGLHNGTYEFFEHLLSLPTIPQPRSLVVTEEMERSDHGPLVSYSERIGPALQSLKMMLSHQDALGVRSGDFESVGSSTWVCSAHWLKCRISTASIL